YDCHSNHTVYPWYNNIAPVSYWMADHVDHGKGDLNFSDWATYSGKKKDHKLEEVVEVMEDEVMPLKEYTWTHEEARLSKEQRKAIIEWAEKTRLLYQLDQRPE
ncbi:MAG: heme-binding domain-containing protein, partial [Eudoraea sp.]|nr:heme-binding domain-containing protein [Eudoraea sp.]